MVTISKASITKWLLLDIYSEMHIARDKIGLFKRKYKTTFADFEKKIKSEKENFDQYDDYIEWKAYESALQYAEKKLSDIKNGNIRISRK